MRIVRSVDRALSILLFIARQDKPEGLSEISRKLNLDKATVLRLLFTLESQGLVRQQKDTRNYEIGEAVALLTGAAKSELRQICRPYLEDLWRKTKETVCLVCPSGAFERTHIEVIPAQHELRLVPNVGSVWPINVGASGRVMMAFLERDEAIRIISETKLARSNAVSVPSKDEILIDLKRIRRDGYLISRGETIEGGVAVAAPVFDGNGRVVGAIAIRAPDTRFSQELLRGYAPSVREAALKLSRELGFKQDPLSSEWHTALGWNPKRVAVKGRASLSEVKPTQRPKPKPNPKLKIRARVEQ